MTSVITPVKNKKPPIILVVLAAVVAIIGFFYIMYIIYGVIVSQNKPIVLYDDEGNKLPF